MAAASVRPAQPGDGLAVAVVQLEVWQTAFAESLPDEVLQRAPAELASAWTPLLGAVLIAWEGNQVTGFAHVEPPVEPGGVGEIALLYVRPAWARRGHGGRLLAAAGDRLLAGGAASGGWWIPVTDVASQRFARAVGWERTPADRAFDTGRAVLRERYWTGGLRYELG